jgi:hypothetical protein
MFQQSSGHHQPGANYRVSMNTKQQLKQTQGQIADKKKLNQFRLFKFKHSFINLYI